MKYKIDFCRIQWLNREFNPIYYAFKYNKNESRFSQIFKNVENQIFHKSSLNNVNSYFVKNSELTQNNSSEVNIFKILTLKEKRTILMIKNIPNKFSLDKFLNIFNQEFEGKFNLFLVPTDFSEQKNYGYAFVNFIDTLDIIYFYFRFNGKKWPNTNSVKVCEIVFSKIQKITKMIKHYPIKVMFQKIIQKKEEEKKGNDDILKKKKNILIPLIYLNEFKIIYPNTNIKSHAFLKDVFIVDENIFKRKSLEN